MPIVQVSDAPVRFELETAPPDGYVMLKRLSYGQKLLRGESAFDTTVQGEGRNTMMYVANQRRKVQALDFAACVVEHNLTYIDDATGNECPFDFKSSWWQDKLDPRVGEEIETRIDSMNNYEKVEGPKN
ncbi:MAG: hypothetical protein ABL876_00195 [Chitinophagaceae bacterium]